MRPRLIHLTEESYQKKRTAAFLRETPMQTILEDVISGKLPANQLDQAL